MIIQTTLQIRMSPTGTPSGSRAGSPAVGASRPNGSRAGSPSVKRKYSMLTQRRAKSRFRLFADLVLIAVPLPSVAEIQAKIPPEGITLNDIIAAFKKQTKGRPSEFVSLLKQISRFDKATKMFYPLT